MGRTAEFAAGPWIVRQTPYKFLKTKRKTYRTELGRGFLFGKFVAAKNVGKTQSDIPPGQDQAGLNITDPGFAINAMTTFKGIAIEKNTVQDITPFQSGKQVPAELAGWTEES